MSIVWNRIRIVTAILAAVILVGSVGIQSALAAPASTQPKRQPMADIFVIVQPPAKSGSATTLTYTLTVSNVGTKHANNVDVVIPLNPAAGRVQSIQLSQDQSRVASQTASSIEVWVGRVDPGSPQTIRLTFAVRPGAGALPIGERASFTWHNNALEHGQGQSNLPWINPSNTIYHMTVAPSGQSNSFAFSDSIFVPGEPVTFWLNTPGGQAITLYLDGASLTTDSTLIQDDRSTGFKKVERPRSDNVRAGPQGDFSISFDASALPAGSYSLVAHGFASGITAIGAFQVQ